MYVILFITKNLFFKMKLMHLSCLMQSTITWSYYTKIHPMNRFSVGLGSRAAAQSESELNLRPIRLLQLKCCVWSAAQSAPLMD